MTALAAGLLAKATGAPLSPADMKALVQGPSERDIVYSGLEGAWLLRSIIQRAVGQRRSAA